MEAGRPRFDADRRGREELAKRFFDAFREGDVDGLRDLLAEDVSLIGDAGGKAPQWKDILGVENVARMLAAVGPPYARIGIVMELTELNGQSGAIFRDRDGRVTYTWALDIVDGQVQTIRTVGYPDAVGFTPGELSWPGTWADRASQPVAGRPTYVGVRPVPGETGHSRMVQNGAGLKIAHETRAVHRDPRAAAVGRTGPVEVSPASSGSRGRRRMEEQNISTSTTIVAMKTRAG